MTLITVLLMYSRAYNVTTTIIRGNAFYGRWNADTMKGYIEERAVEIANFIIENNATVRQTAKQFGISKSTVHTDVTKWNTNKMVIS